jgi:hypothetical protein
MLEQLQKSELTQGPLREYLVLKCLIDLLDCHEVLLLIRSFLVFCRDDHTVGTLAN